MKILKPMLIAACLFLGFGDVSAAAAVPAPVAKAADAIIAEAIAGNPAVYADLLPADLIEPSRCKRLFKMAASAGSWVIDKVGATYRKPQEFINKYLSKLLLLPIQCINDGKLKSILSGTLTGASTVASHLATMILFAKLIPVLLPTTLALFLNVTTTAGLWINLITTAKYILKNHPRYSALAFGIIALFGTVYATDAANLISDNKSTIDAIFAQYQELKNWIKTCPCYIPEILRYCRDGVYGTLNNMLNWPSNFVELLKKFGGHTADFLGLEQYCLSQSSSEACTGFGYPDKAAKEAAAEAARVAKEAADRAARSVAAHRAAISRLKTTVGYVTADRLAQEAADEKLAEAFTSASKRFADEAVCLSRLDAKEAATKALVCVPKAPAQVPSDIPQEFSDAPAFPDTPGCAEGLIFGDTPANGTLPDPKAAITSSAAATPTKAPIAHVTIEPVKLQPTAATAVKVNSTEAPSADVAVEPAGSQSPTEAPKKPTLLARLWSGTKKFIATNIRGGSLVFDNQ